CILIAAMLLPVNAWNSTPPSNLSLDTTCLDFLKPVAGSVISAKACTLSISACESIQSLTLKARYSSPVQKEKVVAEIGKLTRPPFKMIWHTDTVRNQLVDGMSFYCEALLKNGKRIYAVNEGLFLIHNRFPGNSADIRFRPSGKSGFLERSFPIGQEGEPVSGNAMIWWNKEYLQVTVEVINPAFNSSLPPEKLNRAGAEILIDPALDRLPYPTSRVYALTLPLFGKPVRTMYLPEIDDNNFFHLTRKQEKHDGPVKLKKVDFKGFTISALIPMHSLNPEPPESLACNILIKGFDRNDSLIAESWAGTDGLNAYAPVLWKTLNLKPLPFSRHWAFRIAVPFILGIILSLLAAMLRNIIKRKKNTITKFEANEEEKSIHNKIQELISESITDKNLSLPFIASTLGLSPFKIKKIIKKYSGRSFQDYLMNMRTEIARERLRSSHSSEAFIADSSGFAGVHEMEHYFQRFHRTTPYKYRKEFHVA
ncbi:MAG: helix-turn-helix domain-containing protein, partial [Chitinivibrionales bacterium]|nr:helix-turn-helix domain-containing protein [Chitinivibrionales bacterium]